MKTNQDKELKAAVTYLQYLADSGTMEQEQAETVKRAINLLRKAVRSHDPAKITTAIGHVAKIFLRVGGR